MKNILFASVLLILLSSAACKKTCPADVKIGDRPLTEKSLAFFSYSGTPKLVFKDENGAELVFLSPQGVQTEVNKISVYKTCTEAKYDGKSTYEYFEGESKVIYFLSTPTEYSLNFGLFTSTLRPEQELFYDKLEVGVMGVGSIGRGELVTDIHFTNTYEESEFNIKDPLTLIGELTLNGHIFTKVYETSDFEGQKVYYNQEKGVVGFITKNHSYHLDRIE